MRKEFIGRVCRQAGRLSCLFIQARWDNLMVLLGACNSHRYWILFLLSENVWFIGCCQDVMRFSPKFLREHIRQSHKLCRDYLSFLRYVCVHVCEGNISGSEFGFWTSGWRPLLCSLQPCCWFLWLQPQVSFSFTAVSFSITSCKKSLLMVFFSCFLLEWTKQTVHRGQVISLWQYTMFFNSLFFLLY